MKLTDTEILDVYNLAKQQGHPDPLSFIARTDIISNFESGYKDEEGRLGVTGLRPSNYAEQENLQDPVTNLALAINSDISSYQQLKNIDDVNSVFFKGNDALNYKNRPTDFLRKVNRRKETWQKRLDEVAQSLNIGEKIPQESGTFNQTGDAQGAPLGQVTAESPSIPVNTPIVAEQTTTPPVRASKLPTPSEESRQRQKRQLISNEVKEYLRTVVKSI